MQIILKIMQISHNTAVEQPLLFPFYNNIPFTRQSPFETVPVQPQQITQEPHGTAHDRPLSPRPSPLPGPVPAPAANSRYSGPGNAKRRQDSPAAAITSAARSPASPRP